MSEKNGSERIIAHGRVPSAINTNSFPGGLKMNPASPSLDQHSPQSPLDPISRQIFERTHSSRHASAASSGAPDAPFENASLRRVDSAASSKLTKDKKKGVSFLSRIMGNKKKEDEIEARDYVSELSDNRSNGNDAEVFSNPLGFIPRFPPPPKYIKVKAQNRRQRDFDRLFLAQILLGEEKKSRSRKASLDEKIHGIDDVPPVLPSPTSKQTSRAIWASEFSKDGRYLAAAGQDMRLRVWEVISAPEHREGENPGNESDGSDENVRLNAPVFKQKLIREYDGHTSSILDLSWSKNNFLLSSSMDKTVRLYHVSRAECLCAFKHTDFVTSIQFHPRDDRFFLAGSLDSRIRLWSIPDKTVAYMQQVPDMVTAVAFTPDGKTSIAGCLNGMCILYDTEGLKAHSQIHVKSARGKNSKGSKVTGIDTISIPHENGHADVKLLITSNDSRIRMYNLKDRMLEVKFRGNENSCSQIHASFSDDGKFVICGSEDRKVYIWPTGPIERQDSDKRPVEVFEAHSSIVTSAIMVSTHTRRLLAQSGDPLYDLCNPPPVTLVSRAESLNSSKAPTNNSNGSDEQPRNSASPKRALETPAYLKRHTHPGGHVIVTADYSGQIKIFRQDCAYQKRRQESWDASSTFSKKMLARSNSVARRSSIGSSVHRTSLNLGSKNQSADRILSWRNSISSTNGATTASTATASDSNLRASFAETDRSSTRDISPARKWTHRLSLRQSSPRNSPSPKHTTPPPHLRPQPQIEVQGPPPDSPASFHSAAKSPPPKQRNLSSTSDIHKLPSAPTTQDLPHSGGDQLFLLDGQSFRAWNVEHSMLPMAARQPRTPGDMMLDPNGNPLSRQGSVVSQLSSEVMSDDESLRGGGGGFESGEGRRGSRDSRGGQGESSDLTCASCGGTTFKATLGDQGHQLRCKRCGTIL